MEVFDRNPPFTSKQLEIHQSVIRRRRAIGSAADAIMDDGFLDLLYELIPKWMGNRGFVPITIESFVTNIQSLHHDIANLESFTITENENIFQTQVIPRIIDILLRLKVSENKSKVVAGSKTLHHLLPDLIPPIDRKYTGTFFAWHRPYFQDRQSEILEEGLLFFNRLAREVQPQSFVGTGWRTSQTKILDNAIVGYCKVERLPSPS